MTGFQHREEALEAIVRDLRHGAEDLDAVATALPELIDAGFSSDVVNGALSRVGKLALALAQQSENMAEKVHTAKGTYADIENTAEGEMRYHERTLSAQERVARDYGDVVTTDRVWEEYQRDRANEQRSDNANSMEHAEPEPDYEYRSDPTPAPPGPTPAPPTGN